MVEKAAEAKRLVSDRLRAKSIRKRLDDRKMIDKVSDRIRVAQNLKSILNELKAKGLRSESLLRDLRMGQKGDSTKQLHNYVLPEDGTPDPNSKRVQALTKTASKYLRLAEGAAKALNYDPDLIALRLFENTSYQLADDVPDEKIASMDQIRELLVRMAEGAMRRNDLGTYLDTLQSRRIGWDIDGVFGHYGSLPSSIFFSDRAARHVSYLGYAPTVLLYRRDVGPLTSIEGEAYQIDFDRDPDAVTGFLRENRPLPTKHRMPVSVSIYREVWFGIGPMETNYNWAPIFEKRLSFHIRGHQAANRSLDVRSYDPSILFASGMGKDDLPRRLRWLHQFTLLPMCSEGANLSFSVSPHLDTSESIGSEDVQRESLEGRWLIALDRFDSNGLSVDDDVDPTKGQFFYEAVDLASCVKYLDQVADPDDWDTFDGECGSVSLNRELWASYDERESWYQDFSWEGSPEMHVASPKGSIARAIEQNLLRDDTDYRLDAALYDTVAERVRAAIQCYRQVVQNRDNRIAELLQSWKES
ncbi:hypothetical protein [Bradyrhizobium sp. SSUT77]|uniref:hypothetical protein n=1 Tax=Bradyrhizobium sp. SSUT77 TaxID=3040603 RepID=UPI002449E1FC|nr:hypothetical protein [Bradyrhizobium sp. SSUT77]MDH2344947.1 hypothetical protein [Bradyrhizobium sp. SSUT77]